MSHGYKLRSLLYKSISAINKKRKYLFCLNKSYPLIYLSQRWRWYVAVEWRLQSLVRLIAMDAVSILGLRLRWYDGVGLR